MGGDDDDDVVQDDLRMVSSACDARTLPLSSHEVRSQAWISERVCLSLKVKPEKFNDMDAVP